MARFVLESARMQRALAAGAALLGTVLLGCAPLVRSAQAPPNWQEQLAHDDADLPRAANFPLPPPELESLMRSPEMQIRDAEAAGGGVMGAMRIEAHFPSAGRTLKLKWKRAPRGGEGWNNTPRREIAAYEIQKWFLDPDAYVVPTTVARCIPLSDYAVIDDDAKPNLPDVRCVFGMLAIWLEDLDEPEVQLDEERFYRDATYARSIAGYNLLTYLVRNRDTRVGNLLVSAEPHGQRVYSVDNGITFRSELYNFFQRHWNEIRVPALPREAVDRLRAVDAGDLEALRVVAEFRPDGGLLRETEPSPPFGDAPDGVRLLDGAVQLGLEPIEIEGLRQRLEALLDAVDRGEIPVF